METEQTELLETIGDFETTLEFFFKVLLCGGRKKIKSTSNFRK